jgi:hypothetical protein
LVRIINRNALLRSAKAQRRILTYRVLTITISLLIIATSLFSAFSSAQSVDQQTTPKLRLVVSPPRLPADGLVYSSVYVSILSSKGKPIAAPVDVKVVLTSSVLAVGTITNGVIIRAGEAYAAAPFTTTFTPGTTNITASSEGFKSGWTLLTTVTPSRTPAKLGVFAIPATLISGSDLSGRVVVQLQDSQGRPAMASNTINVALASSETSVAEVTESMTIPAGATHAVGTIRALIFPGVTNITASAAGLKTGFTILTVSDGNAPPGPTPHKLKILAASVLLPSDAGKYLMAVLLQDFNGNPVRAPAQITVTLTSSNKSVGDVERIITIPMGKSEFFTNFTSTSVAGSTQITASTPGYQSGQVTIKTISPSPSNLAIFPAPDILLADGGIHDSIVVELRDLDGTLMKAISLVSITLTSSRPSIINVQSSLEIPKGAAFVLGKVTTSLTNGSAILIAQAPGLKSVAKEIKTEHLTFEASLKPVGKGFLTLAPIRFELHVSSEGLSLSGASINWSADKGFAKLLNFSTVTDQNGTAYADYSFSDAGNVTIIASVSKSGYGIRDITTNISLSIRPLTVILFSSLAEVNTGITSEITATVVSAGRPLNDISILWNSNLGVLNPLISVTDEQGMAKTNFISTVGGVANVTAQVSIAGYQSATQTVTIRVSSGSASLEQELLGSIFSFAPYIAILAVAAIILLIIKRRRDKTSKVKESEEEVGEEEIE